MGFTKLYSSIVTSTIWLEDDTTLRIWITMLATADAQGRVDGSIPGLAHISRVSVDACEKALMVLSSPDTYSRTKDYEGRRIEPIDGGWRILNYGKYREKRDPDKRREQTREAVRSHRSVSQCKPMKANVSQSKPGKVQAEAEAEAEEEAEKSLTLDSASAESSPKQSSPARTYRITYDRGRNAFDGITESDWQTWQEAYPGFDVRTDAKRAAIWLRDHPKRRKRNVQAYLTGWFARTQERGSGGRTGMVGGTGEYVAPVERGPDGLTPRERYLQQQQAEEQQL